MKYAVAAFAAVLLTTPASALTAVHSRSGARAYVSEGSAQKFQCLIDRMDAAGIPIRFMGGWRAHGSVRHSLHPLGKALDINQHARNVTSPVVPHSATEMAEGCGLVSGARWGYADNGHFQDGGWGGAVRVARAHRGIRMARLHRVRRVEVASASSDFTGLFWPSAPAAVHPHYRHHRHYRR